MQAISATATLDYDLASKHKYNNIAATQDPQ